MLVLRAAWAIVVVALALWALSAGMPLGAVAVITVGVWLRRAAESGRLARYARRPAHSS